MIPRALAKKVKLTPTASTSTSTSAPAVPLAVPARESSIASTSTSTPSPDDAKLESILAALESVLSDWGLSYHNDTQGNGLLTKLKESKDGFVHLQQVLKIPPIQALTDSQKDLQNAIRSRESDVVVLHESGFQVGRKDKPDYDKLESTTDEDWEEMSLYLENIPAPSSSNAYTLTTFLSSLLQTSIQRLILPPFYSPTTNTSTNAEQTALFLHSTTTEKEKEKRKRKERALPIGGGGFRGFAFVVVGSKEDAERLVEDWKWGVDDEKEEEGMDEGEDDEEPKEKGKEGEKTLAEKKKLAKESGFKVLAYSKWLSLKAEYLSYQQSLKLLVDHAESTSASSSAWRGDPSSRDRDRDEREAEEGRPISEARSVERWGHDRHDSRDRPRRRDQARDPPPHQHIRRPPTPPPAAPRTEELSLPSSSALDTTGAFPKNLVIWLRNLHPKSTKNGLKNLLGSTLGELEEGSGAGVAFVDYEKGLDTCHVRLASAHLATLLHDHISSSPLYHTSPTTFSRTAPPLAPTDEVLSPPLISHILTGTRERIYWEKLPESTRITARKTAGTSGESNVVREEEKGRKKKGGEVREEEVEWMMQVLKEEKEKEKVEEKKEQNAEGGGGERKRKRPSGRF